MTAQPKWLLRMVDEFREPTGEFLVSHPLPRVGLRSLQRAWERPVTDGMVGGVFPVNAAQRKLLEGWLKRRLPTRARSYFLSASTTDWQATKRAGGFMGEFPPPLNFGIVAEGNVVGLSVRRVARAEAGRGSVRSRRGR